MAPKAKAKARSSTPGRAKAKASSSTPVPRTSPKKEAPSPRQSPRRSSPAPSPSRRRLSSKTHDERPPADFLSGLRQRFVLAPEKPAGQPAGKGAASKPGAERSLWAAYLLYCGTWPYVTKSVSCALISCLGDWICQAVVQGQAFDLERSMRFFLVNLLIVGPGLHSWGSLLGRLITRPGLTGAVMQIVPDQLLFSPIFNWTILSAIASLSAFEPRQADPKEWWECQVASWMLWPLVNTLIFWLSPPDLIVLYGNIVGVGWNIYISWKLA